MIPSILAKQYIEAITSYIDTTFPITNEYFKDAFKSFINNEKSDSVFHKPYISIRLPFRVENYVDINFDSIKLQYTPFSHQLKAYKRLNAENPKSTLITTGTGSGKTECFLYPILEYCYKHKKEAGIKAIIIYPMNALASDQARRIANTIHNNKKLKEADIRVGIYVGGKQGSSHPIMSENNIIDDKGILIATPPDILLTNYKMLDYLMIRPKDKKIWAMNREDTLKFIVVDELHTFDGAQGTDLACLIRRLKNRLSVPKDYLCCIGTSATIGSEKNVSNIINYAKDIFAENFDNDSIILEDRLKANEYLESQEIEYYKIPNKEDIDLLNKLSLDEDEELYIENDIKSWFEKEEFGFNNNSLDNKLLLSEKLLKHNFFHLVLKTTNGAYYQNDKLIELLKSKESKLKNLSDNDLSVLLDSLYALISYARIKDKLGNIRPFLFVNVQVWMRELRRVLAKVSAKKENVDFALASDLNDKQIAHYLPVVNCRHCGATGFASVLDEQNGLVEIKDLNSFYNLFFDNDSKIRLIFPKSDTNVKPDDLVEEKLCSNCLSLEFII